MKNIFYHVVTEKPLKLNQEIILDNTYKNGVYKRITKEKSAIDQIYANTEIELTSDLKKALREYALEEVRKSEYPNYPSRLSSLYVSKTLKEAEFWYDLFINQGRPTLQIVKVEIDGLSFIGDAWNCFEGTTNKEKNLELARIYWNQEKNLENKEPITEVLVNGKIKVVEIMKTSDLKAPEKR